MSDHGDTPFPQTDITDLYVFRHPADAGRSVLILNVNADAPRQAATFDAQASYELKIDTDGDAEADIAFHVRFADGGEGRQVATVYRLEGEAARGSEALGQIVIRDAPASFGPEARITEQGGYRFYAGLRSDPFFVDPEGFFNNFQWTGNDANAHANVFGIVLEVPNGALGSQPRIGVWARTLAPQHGALHQMDQVGLPGTAAVFMRSEEDKHAFHGTPPAAQRERFLPMVVAAFEGFGFGKEEAASLAAEWVPDIMPYTTTSAEGYPNGRRLDDDTIDAFVAMVTHGAMTSDLLGPHADLLPEFPYLGTPHGVDLS